MRTVSLLLLSALFLLTVLSCTKSNSAATGTGTWSATVNGVKQTGSATIIYTSVDNQFQVTMQPAELVFYPNILVTTGLGSTVKVDTGTYTFNNLTAVATYTRDTTQAGIFVGSTGQLVISKIDYTGKTSSGTFSFSCYHSTAPFDSIIVTGGTYTGPMTVQ